jgi:hypothetical protein
MKVGMIVIRFKMKNQMLTVNSFVFWSYYLLKDKLNFSIKIK